MKSCVDVRAFHQALQKAYKAAAKGSMLPVLEEACLQFHETACTLTCTNLEQWCDVKIPAQGDEFSFVLGCTEKILAACKYFDGTMEVEYQESPDTGEGAGEAKSRSGTVTIRCGTKELQQRCSGSGDYPAYPQTAPLQNYFMDPKAVYKRFERIKYAAMKPGRSQRVLRTGVEFIDDRMVTVDGARMALNRDPSLRVRQPFFLPAKAMGLLTCFDGGRCCLEVGERYAVIADNTVRLTTRLLEDREWEIDAAIPKNFLEEHIVQVSGLMEELKYLYQFTQGGKKPVLLESGRLSVRTDQGVYRSQLALDVPSHVRCAFNCDYLLEGLKQFHTKKEKTVVLRLTSAVAPIVLLDDEEELALVMPTRMKDAA